VLSGPRPGSQGNYGLLAYGVDGGLIGAEAGAIRSVREAGLTDEEAREAVRIVKKGGGWAIAAFTLLGVLAYVVAFSQFLRYWSLTFGGFQAHGDGYFYWLRYGASWLIGIGFFNVNDAFGWDISDIRPANLLTQGLVWFLNLILALTVLRAFTYAVGFARRVNKGPRPHAMSEESVKRLREDIDHFP